SDVIDVNAKDIKATPDFGTTLNTEFINGLATSNENMVMLLDVDKLLSVDEMTALAQLSDASSELKDSGEEDS
ncbi:MAG: chemotaxis protein CheW, partial [Gammaproteobacteria bacterium]|nr:chemotaxis protein CheW [Gammaproteobacteria bacterium]